MTQRARISATTRPEWMVDLAVHLRAKGLLGPSAAHWGAPDEVLLHSGGAASDIARRCVLLGPPTTRLIARQPTREAMPIAPPSAPLDGEVRLAEQRPPLQIEIQHHAQGGWHLHQMVEGADLAEALRAAHAVIQMPLAGLLTYDLTPWCEPLTFQHPAAPEDLLLLLYPIERPVIHDRHTGEYHIEAPPGDAWAVAVESALENQVPPRPSAGAPTTRTPVTEADTTHAEKVRRVQAAIREGTLYQLNYGRIWEQQIDAPWDIFSRLASANPAPYSAWLSVPDLGLAIASSSPEQLLRQEGRTVSTRPIKGTRPRGDDPEHDANLRGELVGSQKEVAEHLMLVDLERNDLGRICEPASVRWNRWRIESYPHVQHMVSEVTGHLSPELDGFDALQSIFPGGSITGCPKTATVAAIDALEARPRRVWTGSIGMIDPVREISEWSILIRTLEAHEESGEWHGIVQAGGGLVIGSDPLAEVEEAKWKAHALCMAAWGHAPASTPSGTRSDAASTTIHPIPPVTDSVRRLLASRDDAMVHIPAKDLPSPVLFEAQSPLLTRTSAGVRPAVPARPRVLLVDNLDSFTWNIVHAFAGLGAEVVIVPGRGAEADELSLAIDALLERTDATHVVLGPGPARPEASPLTMALAQAALAGECPPTLGICLGHQALGLAAGWTLAPTTNGAVHGVPDAILVDGEVQVMTRYHSLSLTPTNADLTITASDAATAQIVMALEHPSLAVRGVQFHPESVGSPDGIAHLAAFLAD